MEVCREHNSLHRDSPFFPLVSPFCSACLRCYFAFPRYQETKAIKTMAKLPDKRETRLFADLSSSIIDVKPKAVGKENNYEPKE